MKKLVLGFLLVVSLVTHVWADEKDITSRDARALLDKNKSIYLLDVRTAQEYSQGHIAGSTLIPINDFERRIREVPKNKTIIVYCAVGSRSRPAARFLSQQGYREVYHMNDGLVGWYRNGYPIQR